MDRSNISKSVIFVEITWSVANGVLLYAFTLKWTNSTSSPYLICEFLKGLINSSVKAGSISFLYMSLEHFASIQQIRSSWHQRNKKKKNWSQKLKVEISLLPMAVSNWDESIRGRSSSKCKSCSIRLASKKGRKTLMSVHLKNLPQKKKVPLV